MREQQQFVEHPTLIDGLPTQYPDVDQTETTEWIQSFDAVVDELGRSRGRFLLLKLLERAREQNIGIPSLTTTDAYRLSRAGKRLTDRSSVSSTLAGDVAPWE